MTETQTGHRLRTRWWRNRIIVTLALVALLATGNVVTQFHDAAYAADYPSWDDVKNARNNVAKKNAEIVRIQALLKQLEDNAAATQAIAIEKGNLFQQAQEAFDVQDLKATQLQEQADAAQKNADQSVKRAGQLAARMSRTSGTDLTTTLLFNGDDAQKVLADVGMANNITGQSKGLYDRAIQDQNTAQSLTDQANVAKDERERLRNEAEKAQVAAQAAADAATAALKEQQDNNARLQAQLATLKTGLLQTEAAYVKGIQAQWGANNSQVEISSSGWARPAFGRITGNFGPRVPPIGGVSSYHRGTDIGSACGNPIFAAHNGTVKYAGWFGTYGNFILIQHEDGIETGYAHIISGGIMVSVGQPVAVGQQIARVGSTGASTGCHLHFEVRTNGTAIDAVPFLRARGINLT
ncbi:MAG: peptidoglycan DD-metalloendopeptidase family protein [Terrimesophilobacter sp.]